MAQRPSHTATAATPARVLHVRVMAGTGGGPEKTILRSPRHVDPGRYDLTAAYITPRNNPGNPGLARAAADCGCPLAVIEEVGPLDPRAIGRLARLCDQRNVAIWHGHDYKSNLIGLLLRRRRAMKLISTVHNWTDHTWRLKLYRHVDQWTLRHYDRVLTVSPALVEQCKAFGVRADRLRYVPNAIEPHLFRRNRTPPEARRELGLAPDVPVLGYVGRFSREKRIDRLIELVPALRERLGPVQVLLIGDGPQREPLQRLAVEHGVGEAVRFCGWQSPVHRWYEAMDVMVLPSEREGLPNVLLEAMAMGVPVAATAVGANPDLLDAGRCGLLLDNADNGPWLAALGELIGDAAMRRRMAGEARQRIDQRFSFDARMQTIMDEYDRLLGRQGPARGAADRRAA